MSYEDNNPFGEDEERPSFLTQSQHNETSEDTFEPAPFTMHQNHVPVFPKPARTPSNFVGRCQRIDQIPEYLEAGGSISIVDAGKNNEGSGGSFISYTIRTGELEVRRRYSEFESLRASLARLYPCVIVPPIPEKQSLTDYTAGAAKAREDVATIEHRKRMLEQFLRRTAVHRTLKYEKTFHKFLDPNVSWVRSYTYEMA
jgi:sorting nexin-41/42